MMATKTILLACICCVWSLLAAGRPVSAGGSGPFEPLLTHLPAESDLVVLVDLAEGGRIFYSILDKVQNTALVAENPGLAKMFAQQRSVMEAQMAATKASLGFDPFRDLQRAAVGVVLENTDRPGLVLVVTGKFPADLAEKLVPGAQAEQVGGFPVYSLPDGFKFTLLDGKLIVMAPDRLQAALQSGEVPARLRERHPGLFAKTGEGFLLRMHLAVPGFVQALAAGEEAKIVRTLLTSLRRVTIEIDRQLAMGIECADEAGVERAELLLTGWREFMIGGAHMWRAYALMVLGFDIGSMPQLPPEVKAALANRQAFIKTIDEFFPTPAEKPKVARQGNSVSLTALPAMLQGSAFMLGVLSAIAIPSFLKYIQKAKQAEVQVQLRSVQMALDMYRLDNGRYPSTEEGLGALLKSGVLKTIPTDAWGNSLVYSSDSDGSFSLKSLGTDGQPGGIGADADVELRP